MTNNTQLWEKTLFELERELSRANFSTWFKNTSILKQDDGVVIVGVPNEFVKDWLQNKFHKTILRSLRNLSENVRGVEYTVCKTETQKPDQGVIEKAIHTQTTELPLVNLYTNKEDGLNPRYTFDDFIIGSFNELSFAASQAILKKVGTNVYNPLFIYGNTGLGKTHLIQAIGNEVKKHYPNKRVFYTTSEKFSVDYINSVGQGSKAMAIFKNKYRHYDLLIMDDIQFLSNKEKTQEELFHIFNELYHNNKQIIFSSDKHPNYIPALEARLKSRFSAGMIVDIQEPEYESRLAILRAKAKHQKFFPPEEIIEYLASSVQGNIRELEGLLNGIICQSELKNRNLTLSEIKPFIKNTSKPKKLLAVKDIVKVICEFYNIEESFIYEKTRRKEILKPRQIAMFILREDFNISYPTIGQKLGGRDHTTVMHSCEKVKIDIKNDLSLMQEVDQIRAMF
ncbi:MAG: Chromosomal replication initiator protein DnaA [Parcubacteria group bacterium GW2011_GWC1_42_11]|uniref:Chromosomal replication initiator protein DnaA n=1 Tax=Candidatus Nomurabacteria bacterium GW2011_GWC2_42_20 TaxID=1618756 RepID=A0A0G1BPS2_9BACT|nr:MAG: Chromosomal replication initiator protein DnaA [Parcubacteria group bacterium GW2011_GWC1_42_11]KKS48261.1 MAG: Chromosomal replication initiator protein DnaA [Candidatus Nomurabacteria bacterium GW2011_GWC2_42_20]KKT09834.1 MAG: Chromosomal replication initiator protein DnaA [Candidatus Nomurabacteria bacterium GW2011_GWB1_43_20]HBH71841.1 chromosomal replication initiator protein DnaA [Candidatus Yonathbacteria bacterium]